MAKIVDTREYLDMVCQLLAEGHTDVPVPVAGSSMVPFLHNGDTVYLNPLDSPPKKGDVVLYTRPTGQYVLHRIVKVNPDGSFLMLGDAQQELEWIESRERLHARMTRAVHKGKPMTHGSPRWRFYATVWIWVWPLRRKLMFIFGKKKTR
jgi:signal peptidase I